MGCSSDVANVNINITIHVDSVNTCLRQWNMPASRTPGRLRRPPHRYHHGDLRRALLEEAVRTIQHDGMDGLTLRAVGERLRVSRTALYRHFADKGALLAAVARDGFTMLRTALVGAWEAGGGGRRGFEAMGLAYVRFAVAHPAHYRVMFGGFLARPEPDPDLAREAGSAFQVLVDALVAQQDAGLVRRDDPLQLARFIWSLVHGISMLAIDGHLQHQQAEAEVLSAFAFERVRTGIGV
jgi:AcrR family transcriptional regulator